MAVATGSRLGPYEIVAPLGAGGMGEVYRARDTRLGRDVAIKVLRPEVAGDPERVKRFEKEARTVASLSHPNILALFDLGSHEGQPYLVTELLEGQTLAERIRAGDLTVAKAVELGTQIAHGLAAAHEHGVVHRDLKPGNVFVTRDGVVKILDFGLARLTHIEAGAWDPATASTETGLTGAHTVLGTVGYMAPEQVRGQPADHRSDIFAFGCVLYEMLAGERAFRGDTATDVAAAILTKDPPPLSEGIPPLVDRIVRRCLEKRPEDRFQSVRDLFFDLGLISPISGVSVGVQVAPKVARRAVWRWAVVALGIAIGGGLLAVGAFLAGQRSSTPPVPQFQRLTFRRGTVTAARFAPDGQTVVYSAEWDGAPSEVFSVRPESPESRALGFTSAELLAVSPSSEIALLHSRAKIGYGYSSPGTMALVPFAGGTPRDLDERIRFADFSRDSREMAVVRQTDQGWQLEYPVGTVLMRSGAWLSHPRISPDGQLVAFVHHEGAIGSMKSVTVADRAGKTKTLATALTDAWGLAWSSSGDEVWFAGAHDDRTRELRLVSLTGRERVVLSGAKYALHDVGRDGKILVSEEDWRARIFFRGESDAAERQLSWLDWSLLEELSPDGKRITFSESGEGTLNRAVSYLRETSGAPPVKLGHGSCPSLSPDGRSVVVVRRDYFKPDQPREIVVCPIGAGTERTIRTEGVYVFKAGWMPNGRMIWFVGNEPNGGRRLWLTDLAGAKPHPITPEGVRPVHPFITPDGTWAVAASGDGIELYPVAGGEPRPLNGVQGGEEIAAFGADGQSVYAFRIGDIPAMIYRVDLRTGRRELLREVAPSDRAGLGAFGMEPLFVCMTPGGKSYAYGTQEVLSKLYLIEGLK